MINAVRVSIPAICIVLGAGCASVGPQETPVPAKTQAVVSPPRSDRGNPQEYEVMGRRYRVMNSGDDYRDTGVASWYGREFHGKPTSSGERYDMFALTAAHKTLPIPTWVEVTNQRNGKAVIVKVNDRGPFVDDRIIDLSYAAALELDMIRSGTAPVFVRALGAPAALPPDEKQASVASDSRVVFAQVGAFSDQSNAQRVRTRLQSSGFDNVSIVSSSLGSDVVHRVRIGPLDSDALFGVVRDRLSGLGFSGAQMIVEFIGD